MPASICLHLRSPLTDTHMPQSSVSGQLTPNGDVKPYSCLPCRQRKVRCDRRTPCSNCLKTSKECSFIPPVRGKRKRTKPPREGLHAKLRRYEELLRSYGAKVEPSEVDDSESETPSQPDIEMSGDAKPQSSNHREPLDESQPKLITRNGTSRYFDNAPWSTLGGAFQHPEVIDEPIDELNAHESELFFEPDRNDQPEILTSLHPSSQILPKLRDIYADRVDPLLKIIHLPTFWTALTNALRHPQDRTKSLEAAMFAFYLVTITTLKEDECQSLFGVPQPVMFARYRSAARQALMNAGFLSTSSPMVLQAYTMLMMCVRNSYQCDTLFVLSGVAIRLARKMGLHRDGTSLGLSPFETEMRRRLWWHLVQTDYRTADVLGTKPSLDLTGDVKMPLNVEDEALHPNMVDLPQEHNGITSVALCLLRCEVIETLRSFSATGDVRFEILSSPDIPLAKKDSVINQVEDHIERKYLRYCDPSNALHNFVSIMSRSSICKMRLFAHNPRQFANSPVEVPQSERDIVFANATKLLEYMTLIQGGNLGLEKYLWQIGTSHLWNTILYVLIEARHRKAGPEIDRLWQLIGVVFSQYPQVFEVSTGPVYTALGKWTLEVWDEYVMASKSKGLPEPQTPDYINAIRRLRRPGIESLSIRKGIAAEYGPTTPDTCGYNSLQFQKQDNNLPNQKHEVNLTAFEGLDSYDFPPLLSFEMNPNEWTQWEQLLAGEGDFAQFGTMVNTVET